MRCYRFDFRRDAIFIKQAAMDVGSGLQGREYALIVGCIDNHVELLVSRYLLYQMAKPGFGRLSCLQGCGEVVCHGAFPTMLKSGGASAS